MRLIRLLKNDLAEETHEWVDAGIIETSQAEKICQYYDVSFDRSEKKSLGYNVLIGLAYLFIGLALIILIGSNWDDISRELRMAGLISLTAATQLLAIRKYHTVGAEAASILFLLGNLFYGAAIILIAQIYHLGEHMPDGVFWWALGCLPAAIILKSRLLCLQALLLAYIWFFLELSMGFYPLLFPLFLVAGLYVLVKAPSSIVLFISVLAGFFIFSEYAIAEIWREGHRLALEAEHVFISLSMFALAYVCAHGMSKSSSVAFKDYAAVMSMWTLRFALIFLIVMSFSDPWDSLLTAHWEHQLSMQLIITVLTITSFLVAYKVGKLSMLIPIQFCILLTLFAVLSGKVGAQELQLVYNVILVVSAIVLVIKGIQSGATHYFFLGVATLLLTALMRYIDLIGDYIGGALLFMFFAFLLLAAARYWKSYQHKEVSA